MEEVVGASLFSENYEKEIVQGLLTAANWGFPVTRNDLRHIARRFLDRKGTVIEKFTNNLTSVGWIQGFFKELKNVITQRLCENMKKSRAAVSETIINEYFDNLQDSLRDVPPTHLLNYDESNVTDDPGQQIVLVRRGAKHA